MIFPKFKLVIPLLFMLVMSLLISQEASAQNLSTLIPDTKIDSCRISSADSTTKIAAHFALARRTTEDWFDVRNSQAGQDSVVAYHKNARGDSVLCAFLDVATGNRVTQLDIPANTTKTYQLLDGSVSDIYFYNDGTTWTATRKLYITRRSLKFP